MVINTYQLIILLFDGLTIIGWLACGTGKSSSSSVSGGGGLAGAVSCGRGGLGGPSVNITACVIYLNKLMCGWG